MVWTSDSKAGKPGSSSQASNSGSSAAGKGGTTSVTAKPDASGAGDKRKSFSGSKGDPGNRFSSSPISEISSFPSFAGRKAKDGKGPAKPPSKPGIFLLIGGVILPVAAIVVELSTHLCAKNFFDPLPTPAHVLLFSLIPLTNFLVWMAARRNLNDMLGTLTLGTGMAMGVAILYSLMFLPLVPLSVVAILWFGFGLLALAPILSIPAVWKASKYAVHLSHHHKTFYDGHQLEHIGHMIILCTVVAVELPSTLTRMHIGEAAHSLEPAPAIEWLRKFGNQEVMLRACYERSGRATDILGSLYEVRNPVNVNEAREIFYRVTGKPFNSVPLPSSLRATRQNQGLLSDSENEEPNVEDEFDRDPDIAGEAVSGVARGLTMNESKLSGSLDGDKCIANLIWNVTFGNSSKYDREVRSKILLPPGAVVTNAFLIVDGREREATVMGRSLARRKYRAAVSNKKDPLLVSTCGADQVLLQLFPVAPESKIGVRLHIVSPLAVPALDKAQLLMPTFEERNFQVDIPTSISLKSASGLSSSSKELKVTTGMGSSSVEGSLTTPDLARFGAVLTVDRDPKVISVEGSADRLIVSEKIAKTNYPRPNTLTLVIDGSNGMAPHMAAILRELNQLPSDIALKVIYVRDGLMDKPVHISANDLSARADVFKKIEALPCAGGQNNSKQLTDAVEDTVQYHKTAVLWLHSSQPIPGKLKNVANLHLRLRQKPTLYDFAVAAGPNEILSGLYSCPGLVRVQRGNDVQSDLHRLFEIWKNSTPDSAVGGIKYAIGGTAPGGMPPAEPALLKLAVFDEISKLQTGHPNHHCKYAKRAVSLSNEFHLVTPYSSAIITEPINKAVRLHQISPRNSGRSSLFSFFRDQKNAIGPSMSMSVAPPLSYLGSVPMGLRSRREDYPQAKSLQSFDAGRFATDSLSSSANGSTHGSLSGATNGTLGPSMGDQFSSAAVESDKPGNNEGVATAQLIPSPMPHPAAAPPAPVAGGNAYVSELKESRAKSDASEEGEDESGSDYDYDGNSAPDVNTSMSPVSPVVPESDTYLLMAVGVAMLAFALKNKKKLSAKKA